MKVTARTSRFILGLALAGILPACAVLHKAQLGDVDGRSARPGSHISIKVSESTVDLGEAASVARSLGGKKSGANAVGDAATIDDRVAGLGTNPPVGKRKKKPIMTPSPLKRTAPIKM